MSKLKEEKVFINKISHHKDKVLLSLSNNTDLEINEDIVMDFYLYEHKEISVAEIDKIKHAFSLQSSLKYAYKLVSRNSYTEKELRKKLQAKSYIHQDINNVIQKLKQLKYIDDNKYFNDAVESMKIKGYGPLKIYRTLKEKGITEDILKNMEYSEDEEKSILKAKLPKLQKQYQNYNFKSQKQHICNSLLNAGFHHDLILDTLDDLIIITDDKILLRKEINKIYERYKKKNLSNSELHQSLVSYFIRKGYNYKDIQAVLEDIKNENI